MSKFMLDMLEACEPESLSTVGTDVTVMVEDYTLGTSSGCPCVTLTAPTRQGIIDFVRKFWGDDDGEWFQQHVVERVSEMLTPRTILVHLNVELDRADERTADTIADTLLAALTVGLDPDETNLHMSQIVCPLADEV